VRPRHHHNVAPNAPGRARQPGAGLIPLSGDDLEAIIMGGLDVFLRAYRAS
jgi:hypothetical protein